MTELQLKIKAAVTSDQTAMRIAYLVQEPVEVVQPVIDGMVRAGELKDRTNGRITRYTSGRKGWVRLKDVI